MEATPTSAKSFNGGNGGRRGGRGGELEDPFCKLETVWSSLESWFDLILVEVNKTTSEKENHDSHNETRGHLDLVSDGDKTDGPPPPPPPQSQPSSVTPVEGGKAANSNSGDEVVQGSRVEESEGKKDRAVLRLGLSHTNEVAAAIVHTTPIERRKVFLG